jgi:membrane associated rhomboid family serine protease
MNNITDTVKHLIIINIIFYIGTALFGDLLYGWFSLWFPKNEHFGIWQIVTHMFMHGGLMHIFFNMYALFAFGTPLEQMWGRQKFLFFYFSAGIGAALLHTGVNYLYVHQALEALGSQGVDVNQALELVSSGRYNTNWYSMADASVIDNFLSAVNTPAVGASGAIYGVLVAFGMAFPESKLFLMFVPVPIKAKYFIPALIGLDLFSGVTGYSIFGSGIAHFAHVGGALIGFIMAWYWKRNQFNNRRWD